MCQAALKADAKAPLDSYNLMSRRHHYRTATMSPRNTTTLVKQSERLSLFLEVEGGFD
jgi:hypothetical protein